MVKSKAYILVNHFVGLPKPSDLKIVEEELPKVKDGEFLAEALFLSVDPYMFAMEPLLQLGCVFIGSQVAKIIESKSVKYPVGKHVVGQFGWRTYTISNGSPPEFGEFPAPWLLPDIGDHPKSLGIGGLGLTGNSAYLGLLDICKPKKGETIVVSTAGGAVGSHVGQLAKMKGCKVIGITGSDEKGRWVVEELGFDYFINYKNANIKKALSKCAPEGIDCYFDNVGGEISNVVIGQMKFSGSRIAVCGYISGLTSGTQTLPKVTMVQKELIWRSIKMEGFVTNKQLDRWHEGVQHNLQWLNEKKLKFRETVTIGFENMLAAFVDMLQGRNIGKAVVKV